jgi:hypothetical protein
MAIVTIPIAGTVFPVATVPRTVTFLALVQIEGDASRAVVTVPANASTSTGQQQTILNPNQNFVIQANQSFKVSVQELMNNNWVASEGQIDLQ